MSREHIPTGRSDTWAYGVCFDDVMEAAEVCPDTSVLEALFPWAFETAEGKELLERKRVTAEKREEKKTEADHAEVNEVKKSVTSVDKIHNVTTTLTPNEVYLVNSLLNKCYGWGAGTTIGKTINEVREKLSVLEHYGWLDGAEIKLPDGWFNEQGGDGYIKGNKEK